MVLQENARKATGIPRDELMQTTADDPQAYLHPVTGQYVVPKMHKYLILDLFLALVPRPFF